MIDTEPTPVVSTPPAVEGAAPWFYPAPPPGGPASAPLSRRERFWIAARVRGRLAWTRLRFRLWWLHRLRLGLVQARLRLRLALLRLGRRVRPRP